MLLHIGDAPCHGTEFHKYSHAWKKDNGSYDFEGYDRYPEGLKKPMEYKKIFS